MVDYDVAENIKFVTDILSAILNLEDSQMYEAFADIYTIWEEDLCFLGMKELNSDSCARMVAHQQLCQSIAIDLANILKCEDMELLERLQVIRKKNSKYLLSVATRSLNPSEQTKLKKMVILQNICNGEKPSDKPWTVKSKVAPPKRTEFTKELLAKV
jgi:hypothetical protein